MEGEDSDSDSDTEDNGDFGLFHYVMAYCRNSNTPLEQCFDTPAILVFITVSYVIKEREREKREMERWKRSH